MIQAKCDVGHDFTIPAGREGEQASNCPTCGLLTWNPEKPKREKIVVDGYFSKPYTDSDSWSPFCPGLGELDRAKIPGRIKDGTLRVNPKTGCLEGYFDTRKKYEQALKDQGVVNSWGVGKIDPSKQGWDSKDFRRKYHGEE